VLDGGRQLAAELVKRDDDLDLATFRIPGARGVPLPLGDATALGPGDKVVLIGSPRGLEFTVHEGIVSNAGRNHLGVAYLQIDANVNPGNSGGPLLDGDGRVVGVVSMMVGRGSGLGLVLPVNYAYEGPAPFVPAPNGAGKGRWKELLARVGESDRREVEQINTALEGYPGGLVALTAGRDGVPTAVVARRFRTGTEPPPVAATFEVFQGGHRRCGRTYTIDRWQVLKDEPGGDDGRFHRWMKRNRVTEGLFVGFADLRWIRSDCSTVDWGSDAELRLQAARPPVDSLTLRAGGTGGEAE
jgi:serine protease Do